MSRVYLETSFFSACVTTRGDVESLFWKQETLAWLQNQGERHDLFVSTEVIAELSHPSYRLSRAALAFAAGISVLDVTPEVLGLAEMLIREKVMPAPIAGDAVHVAAAAFHRMDYLLTWNVRHLANPNKRTHLARLCLRAALVPPEIVTPINLWELDDDLN